jgi:hypothetical protein
MLPAFLQRQTIIFVFPLSDPRRQVEYSVKARLVRISIELVFEDSLSAKPGAPVDSSSPMDGSLDLCGQRSPDGWAFDDLDLRVELDKDEVTADCESAGMLTAMERIDEYLEVQLAELNISVVVSLEAFKNNVLRNLSGANFRYSEGIAI